jgi:hypothetical protein
VNFGVNANTISRIEYMLALDKSVSEIRAETGLTINTINQIASGVLQAKIARREWRKETAAFWGLTVEQVAKAEKPRRPRRAKPKWKDNLLVSLHRTNWFRGSLLYEELQERLGLSTDCSA